MLEFYPMPTQLNHGNSLYPHHLHQNHGSRFLDNISAVPSTQTVTQAIINGGSNCGQQQQVLTNSASYASSNNNNNNNNNNSNNNNNNNIKYNNNNCNNSNHNKNNKNSSQSSSISVAATTATASLASQTISSTPLSITTPTTTAPTKTQIEPAASANASTNPMNVSHPVLTPKAITSTISSISCLTSANSSPSSTSSSSLQITTTAAATASLSSASLSFKMSADCSGRTDVGHIKREKNYEICEGCGQKIYDRYLMNVGDSNWHEQCLCCCYCGTQLHHTCYVRNAKLYCKLDYDRLFGIKCAACCHPILPQEMVMRPTPTFVFHLPCFVCCACRRPLQKGDQFTLRDGQLFCYRHDLEKEMYLAAAAAAQHCGFVGLDDEDLMRPRDGRRGPKRPRTILTSQQRKQFKASFDQSPKPCRKVREALAKDTGLSVRVVQVWFQNQRAKMKKIQRKVKNSGTTGANGRNGNGSVTTDKDKDRDMDEKCVKQESGSGSENSYMGLDSVFSGQPLNPNLPFSPEDYPANSNDSFCSSDLSLDGSNFDQIDDDTDSLSLNNLELQSTSSSGNHHTNPHDMLANLNTSLINPIDKLYLMQNSYFNSEQ